MPGTLSVKMVKDLADQLRDEKSRRMNPGRSEEILSMFHEWRMAPDYEKQAIEVKNIIEYHLVNRNRMKPDPHKCFTSL